MFLNSFSKINIKSKKKQSHIFFNNIYYKTGSLGNNLQQKDFHTKFLSSTTKKNNYINYTFSEKSNKFIPKTKSSKFYHKKSLNSNKNKKPKLTIVNDYLKSFQKTSNNWKNSLIFSKESNINFKSSRNIFNNTSKENNFNKNYYNEEVASKNNISKISNNFSFKTFLNDNNNISTQSKIEPYDLMETNNEKSSANYNTNNFSRLKIRSVIKSNMPIFKRIKILKEAKSYIDKMQKKKINSTSSFKTFLEESSSTSKFYNYSLEKNKNNFEINNYEEYYSNNAFNNKKPIIIKYMPKPKLLVPKFVNINSVKI